MTGGAMAEKSETLMKARSGPDFLVGNFRLGRRLAIAGGIITAGIAVQLLLSGFFGAAVIAAGVVFVLPRGVSNKPGREKGKASWERVTEAELDFAFELEEKCKRWGGSLLDINCGRGFAVLLGAAAATALAVFVASRMQNGFDLGSAMFSWSPGFRAEFLLVDAVIFLLPVWVSGMRMPWSPTDLMIKLRALHNVRARLRAYPDPDVEVTPMFEVAAGVKGAVPRDARLMLRWRGAPEGFIGVQVQVSLNRVQGRPFPYLYGVVIAKKGFGLAPRPARSLKDVCEFESKDPEVDVLVVRQKTSRNSGYHTVEADQVRVLEAAMETARDALA